MDASGLVARLQTGDITLYDLRPQEFEEVIAELLASMGWEVSPTPPTQDTGLDIIGISRDATGFESTWLVECKRYAPKHQVGPAVIRQLFGVKTYVRADHALLVTQLQPHSRGRRRRGTNRHQCGRCGNDYRMDQPLRALGNRTSCDRESVPFLFR